MKIRQPILDRCLCQEVPGMGLDNTFTYAFGLEHDLGNQYCLYGHYGNGVVYPTPDALGLQSAAGDGDRATTWKSG